jgi:PAS domain S-box-containing protein
MHFYQLETGGRLVFTGGNPAADSILGISHADLIGKPIEEAFPLFSETGVPDIYRNVASTGDSWKTEQINYQDGEISGSLIVAAFRTGPGRMVASFLDITERRRAEDELRAAYEELAAQEEELRIQYTSLSLSEAEWDATFNGISDWVTLISPEGRILRSNRSGESVLNLPSEEIAGKNCYDLVHGEECMLEDCPRLRMSNSRKREIAEIPVHEGNAWYQIVVDPILDETGKVVRAVHIVRDITDRVRSQRALDQAKRKLNYLNEVIFSDISNFVYILTAYQELLKSTLPEQYDNSILRRQYDVLQSISDSLSYARSFQDLGFKPARWQNVTHVFLMAISHIPFETLSHKTDLDGMEIFADPMLEQVFQILAENTLIHGTGATQVDIRYHEAGESAIITYEDNGQGISPEIKNLIFSPDYHNKKTVGLYLAGEILEITGIRIQETGEFGKGARFEITVPKGTWRIQINNLQ